MVYLLLGIITTFVVLSMLALSLVSMYQIGLVEKRWEEGCHDAP